MQVRYEQVVREIANKHPGAWGISELLELVEQIKEEHEDDIYFENVFPRYKKRIQNTYTV